MDYKSKYFFHNNQNKKNYFFHNNIQIFFLKKLQISNRKKNGDEAKVLKWNIHKYKRVQYEQRE